jgi:hypothetical protein
LEILQYNQAIFKAIPNNLNTTKTKSQHTTRLTKQEHKSKNITTMTDKAEFSPSMPITPVFDVQARIKELQGFLDPSNPNYQPERQHKNIRAVIKLYEEGKIDGLKRTTIIDGKIVPYKAAFESKSGSWTEVSFFIQAQRYGLCGGRFRGIPREIEWGSERPTQQLLCTHLTVMWGMLFERGSLGYLG